MKDEHQKIIAAVDIGATKICVLIAAWAEGQPLEILGIGRTASRGMKKGVVININDTVTAVNTAVEEAENQAGIRITEAYVGISGEQIKGLNNHGVITVTKSGSQFPSDQEITAADRQRVLDHAKSITLPLERRILHVLPQEFKVDDYSGIKDPEGMTGHRLEARVHLVTSVINAEKNLRNCCEKAGIEVQKFVVQPLASSLGVSIPNERKQGVAILDIGGGTTDVIVYHDGGVYHTGVIPYGGDAITSDIAHGVQTTLEQAEKLKVKCGVAKEALASADPTITVPGTAGRKSSKLSPKELAGYIEPRMKEILHFAAAEIRKSDHPKDLNFGIVLTGGGAKLLNVGDLAQEIFHMPVKIGLPLLPGTGLEESLQDPRFATAVGLICFGIEDPEDRGRPIGRNVDKVLSKVKKVIQNWF